MKSGGVVVGASVLKSVSFFVFKEKIIVFQCCNAHASWACGRSDWRRERSLWRRWLGVVRSCSVPEGASAGQCLR